MNKFWQALFSPVRVFNELKTVEKFSIMSIVVMLLLMLINQILMIPITTKVTSITLSTMSLPENQIDTMLQVSYKMRYLQVIGSIFTYMIMFLFYAFLLYFLVRIVKNKLGYKKVLQIIIYSYFIVAVGDLINTALLYMRGIDAIKNIYDTSLTGINLLTSLDRVGAVWYVFLTHIAYQPLLTD
ncbi:hypothetical protein AGMMS50262_21720 [Bacteroidia bacterium]|nr:hypothetical protein AGMMS50262_21720 [Bacteroidia bacterium]